MPKTQKSGMKLTEWAWSFLAVIVYVNGVAPSAQPSRSTIRRRPGFPKEQIRPASGKCVRSLLPQHVRGSTFSAARVGNQHATSAAILESGFIRDFAKDIDPVQPFARLDIIKDR